MAELQSYFHNGGDRLRLCGALVVAQLGVAGLSALLKSAEVDMLSRFVFPFYQNCIGFLVLAPLAYLLERDRRPDLRFSTICRLFILGSIAVVVNQVGYVTSSNFTPSSFLSAMDVVTPLVTSVLAAACWLEDVHLRRRDGRAKVMGIFISCCGVVFLSLNKGPPLVKAVLFENTSFTYIVPTSETWEFACISFIGSISLAIYLILQVPVLTRYPAPLSVAAFSCLFGALELAVLAVVFERDTAKWVMHTQQQVYTIFYAGIIGTGLLYAIQSWAIYRGGPVLVAVYQPLKTVFACALTYLFWDLPLRMSSVTGAFLAVMGIYLFHWGREEQRRLSTVSPLTQPLSAAGGDY